MAKRLGLFALYIYSIVVQLFYFIFLAQKKTISASLAIIFFLVGGGGGGGGGEVVLVAGGTYFNLMGREINFYVQCTDLQLEKPVLFLPFRSRPLVKCLLSLTLSISGTNGAGDWVACGLVGIRNGELGT